MSSLKQSLKIIKNLFLTVETLPFFRIIAFVVPPKCGKLLAVDEMLEYDSSNGITASGILTIGTHYLLPHDCSKYSIMMCNYHVPSASMTLL